VRTAETGGDTVKILENLSVYYANQAQLKSQVFHAFLYPTIVAGVALAVIIFLLTTVMPIFVEIITAMGSEIPPTTAALLAISSGAAYVLPILLLIVILGVLLARLFRERVPSLEKFRDRIVLHLPVMGKITSYREWLRLTDALEILLSNGVNLLYALEVAGGVTENRHLQREMAKLQDGVRSGHALSESLAKASVFDQNFYQMVRVGESSGTMADVLGKISLYYRDELDRWIKTVTTIMEPAVLIAVGLVVMFIVVSVMSPIYTIYEGYIQLM
jgi:type IV pilus assembly protein PilC